MTNQLHSQLEDTWNEHERLIKEIIDLGFMIERAVANPQDVDRLTFSHEYDPFMRASRTSALDPLPGLRAELTRHVRRIDQVRNEIIILSEYLGYTAPFFLYPDSYNFMGSYLGEEDYA